MKKISSIIVVLVAFFLTVSPLYAQTQREGSQHSGRQKESVFKELNLTPEQQKKLEGNRKAQQEEMVKLHKAIEEKQAQLQGKLKDPAITRAAVEPILNNVKSLQAQLIDHRINSIFAVKEILTQEQFAKFQQMTQARKGDKKGHFQNWRERRKDIDKNCGQK